MGKRPREKFVRHRTQLTFLLLLDLGGLHDVCRRRRGGLLLLLLPLLVGVLQLLGHEAARHLGVYVCTLWCVR